mmetsp:Transcript_12145/g.14126  ORF Transcript_12145/g.14126 Transcript_12145/m.14126 type:complete len:578 (+) Transcript_12145:128-1861(+)
MSSRYKKSSSKKKGNKHKQTVPGAGPNKKEIRQKSNQLHNETMKMVKPMSTNNVSAQVIQLFQQLATPRPTTQSDATMRQLLTLSGTNVKQNDDEPYGNGDQSDVGEPGFKGEQTRQILRNLFSEGADLDSYICFRGFSPFAFACATGNVSVVKQMLLATKFDSIERKNLLERRETGMRYPPIILTVALYKSRNHVAMRLHLPESEMDHLSVFKLLLKYGATPDSRDVTGKTIIHYAAGSMAQDVTLQMADYCIDASKSSAYVGQKVTLRELSKDSFNGLEGTLGGYLADTGRRQVFLKDSGKELSLQPKNIFRCDTLCIEKCVYDESRNLVDDQDRMGMTSLMEVYMSNRIDVAKYLTEKHNANIDIQDRGNISVRKMAYQNGNMVSDMAKLFRKHGTKQSMDKRNTCILCGKCNDTLSTCSRCKSVTYCSVECQKKHWKEHKKTCKPLQVKHIQLSRPKDYERQKERRQLNTGGTFCGSGRYTRPLGIEVDEMFWMKAQIGMMVEGIQDAGPHLLYDKSRSCSFYVNPGEPGHKEIWEKVKSEDAYMGMKSYFEAKFGKDGNCTIFLDKTALKSW